MVLRHGNFGLRVYGSSELLPYSKFVLLCSGARGFHSLTVRFSFLLLAASEALTGKLRSLSFRAIIRSDISWFDEERNSVSLEDLSSHRRTHADAPSSHSSSQTGALTSSLSENAQKISGLAGVTLGTIIQSCATIVAGAIIGTSLQTSQTSLLPST